MEIDALDESQHARAVALWQEVGLTRPWNDPDADLCRAVQGPASTVLAAVDDGVLLATAMVGHDGHRGWVYYLAVAPVARGRGLGRQMMRACEEWLRDRGLQKVQLMVRFENADVLAFYRRLGYLPGDVVVLARWLDEEVS